MAYTNIDDPSAYFQTVLWSGNASTQSITNDGNSDLKPDWAWTKDGIGYGHKLMDSSRGIGSSGKFLITNSTAAESSINDYMMTFDTNGFSVGAGDAGFNASNDTYVTWQWKANGGTTVSNTSGSTTTTVQANQDAGFSILTWTGNGATTTLGHGLGVKPEVIIQKARGTTSNWAVYHKDAGPAVSQASYNVATYLNLTDATGIASNSWGTAASDINSNTFYLKYWFNYNTTNVAYCFASKQGYSKFGKYVGNGNTNGAFVYTGFKPAFVMTKPSSAVGSWSLYDHKRTGYNPIDVWLRANGSDAESTSAIPGEDIDILSNGFKFRNGDNTINGAYSTYIYMAFAENPFVTSTGIPTTAR